VATLKRRHPPALTYDRATDAIDAVAAACDDEAAPVSGAALRALLPFLRGANVGAAQAALEAIDNAIMSEPGTGRGRVLPTQRRPRQRPWTPTRPT
jgi:hypothetical protein